jgi:hypothetical protein
MNESLAEAAEARERQLLKELRLLEEDLFSRFLESRQVGDAQTQAATSASARPMK